MLTPRLSKMISSSVVIPIPITVAPMIWLRASFSAAPQAIRAYISAVGTEPSAEDVLRSLFA
jgi:hypothetical protein